MSNPRHRPFEAAQIKNKHEDEHTSREEGESESLSSNLDIDPLALAAWPQEARPVC
jgi:hypothetical protein